MRTFPDVWGRLEVKGPGGERVLGAGVRVAGPAEGDSAGLPAPGVLGVAEPPARAPAPAPVPAVPCPRFGPAVGVPRYFGRRRTPRPVTSPASCSLPGCSSGK